MYILHSVYHIYDVYNIHTLTDNKKDFTQSFAFDMSDGEKSPGGWFWHENFTKHNFERKLVHQKTLINETPGVNKPGADLCFF